MFGYMEQMVKEINSEECYEAYKNRIVLSTMEMCLNVTKNQDSLLNKYKEVGKVLNNTAHKNAFKGFKLKFFPLKWKVYYFFAKHRMTAFVFAMSLAIRKIQKRG